MKKIVVTSFEELDKVVTHLKRAKKFSYDVETTREGYDELMADGISVKPSEDALRYHRQVLTGISFCDGQTAWYIPVKPKHRKRVISFCQKLFSSEGLKTIAHNIVFDAKVLFKHGVDTTDNEWFDTQVAAHLLDENREKGLKYLTRHLLGKEVVEFDSVGWNHYTEEFYKYGLDDAINTWELHSLLLPEIVTEGLDKLFLKFEMPFLKALLQMEVNGVRVNVNKAQEYKKELAEEISDLEVKMYEEAGIQYEVQYNLTDTSYVVQSDFNFNSPKQLAELLFDQLGLEPIEFTPTGQRKTGRVTLEKYKDNKFVALLRKYKACQKLLSAFINPLDEQVDEDGRIRPHFSDTGTVTGRLSCSKPNLQQLPNDNKLVPVDYRSLYEATPGYKMIMADYSGQEVAIMAQVSGDPTLTKILSEGKDVHLSVANLFFNLGIEDELLYESHDKHNEVRVKFDKERKAAKTITFGLAYGKGAFGLSKDFNITEDEAQVMIDKYFALMPTVKQTIEETHEEVKKRGFVRNMAGRFRRFKPNEQGYYPNGAFRQSFNFLIQSAGAEMIRLATIKVVNLQKLHPEWDLRLLMTVHDEVVFEAKEQYAMLAGEAIKKAFESVAKFKVPVVAEVQLGNNYSEAK